MVLRTPAVSGVSVAVFVALQLALIVSAVTNPIRVSAVWVADFRELKSAVPITNQLAQSVGFSHANSALVISFRSQHSALIKNGIPSL